jgi:hypothetical protein
MVGERGSERDALFGDDDLQPTGPVETVAALIVRQEYGIGRADLLGGYRRSRGLRQVRSPPGTGPGASNAGSVSSRRPPISARAVGPPIS